MNVWRLSVLAVFVLLWPIPGNFEAFGVEVPLSRMSMKPETPSDDLLGEVIVENLQDGSRRLSSQGLVGASQNRSHFVAFVIDPGKGIYRAVALTTNASDNARKLEALRDRSGTPSRPQGLGANLNRLAQHAAAQMALHPESGVSVYGEFSEPPPLCGEVEACDFECRGSWVAAVTTFDPVFEPLTKTTARSSWSRETMLTCKWRGTGSNQCWAANPSRFNTHWYVNTCGRQGPITSDLNYTLTAIGSYYNWDFGLNFLQTSVFQSVTIQLLEGLGTGWSWEHVDWGEWSELIHGSFDIQGSNTCF